jgi:HK97 family phage prohead protease
MPTPMSELQEARAVLDAARAGRTVTGRLERRLTAASSAAGPAARAAAPDAAGTVTGYAAVFNSETVIAGLFRETLAPGAFKDSIAADDVRVAFNHDPNFIFGRNRSGTADFEEDRHGLRYTARAPEATWAKDALASIARGDISGSSFQFFVERDEDEEWDFSQTTQGKLPLRTIKRARIFEAGPVSFPAYTDTTASTRGEPAAPDPTERLEMDLQLRELEYYAATGVDLSAGRSADTDMLERELRLRELEYEERTGQRLARRGVAVPADSIELLETDLRVRELEQYATFGIDLDHGRRLRELGNQRRIR